MHYYPLTPKFFTGIENKYSQTQRPFAWNSPIFHPRKIHEALRVGGRDIFSLDTRPLNCSFTVASIRGVMGA